MGPGTIGFQSPEVLNALPCSTWRDAFSVGAIISSRMQVVGREKSHSPQPMARRDKLHNVAIVLNDANPKSQWSFSDTLHVIHHDKQQHSDLPTVKQYNHILSSFNNANLPLWFHRHWNSKNERQTCWLYWRRNYSIRNFRTIRNFCTVNIVKSCQSTVSPPWQE